MEKSQISSVKYQNNLKQQVLQKGYPPSVREICDAVGLKSTSSVHAHLESLERNGYIRKDPTKPRAIEIVDDGFNLVRTETVYIPEVGKVAAGQPILAIENIDAYLPFPAYMIPQGKDVFVLTVKGDSMVDAGIFLMVISLLSLSKTPHRMVKLSLHLQMILLLLNFL